jgi:L-2,4-diaminobutyrate decarboxylase
VTIRKSELEEAIRRATVISEKTENTDEINKKVRRQLLHNHGVVIGQTVSNGHVCLKFTLLNPLMTHEKLDSLRELICQLSKQAEEN